MMWLILALFVILIIGMCITDDYRSNTYRRNSYRYKDRYDDGYDPY